MESTQGKSKIRKARQHLKAAECKRILKSNLDECRAALQQEKKNVHFSQGMLDSFGL